MPLFKVALREPHQLAQLFAAMVAAYRFVQPSPDRLDRVTLRTPRRQRIQAHSPFARSHVLLDSSARVARVIVYGQMKLPVAAVDPPQLRKRLQKKLMVFALPDHPMEAAGPPAECP